MTMSKRDNNTIQCETYLVTGECSEDLFTLVADAAWVRGVFETDLTSVHNDRTGEMFDMHDWEAMLDDYDGDWADDGVKSWDDLQELVAVEGL